MKSREIPVRITNIGGVSELKLSLQLGVNELLGPNGSGKTSAIRATTRLFGGEVPIEVRDGSTQGTVESLDAKISVKRVVKASGAAEVELADSGPLADLIDPGMKDSEAAARARVRALLRLVNVPVTDGVVATLAGHPAIAESVLTELHEGAIDDLLGAAERVRLTGHRMAREAEARAQQIAGHVQAAEMRVGAALEKLGGEDGLVDTTAAQAEAAGHEAVRAAEVARIAASQRRELEQRQAEIRASLGDVPQPGRFDDDIEARRGAVAAHERRLAELTAQAAKERELMAGVREDLRHLEAARAAEVDRFEQHREAARVLALPVEGPTEEEVQDLQGEVERRKALFRVARLSDEVRQARETAAAEREAHRHAAEQAEMLRALATSVQNRLGLLLHGTDAEGMTIVDGRLAVLEDGEVYDFEHRRSEGQRIAAALRVAAKAYRGKVVPLEGRYWMALDEEHREELARRAAELGLYVITERPAEGELRSEPVSFNPLRAERAALGGAA